MNGNIADITKYRQERNRKRLAQFEKLFDEIDNVDFVSALEHAFSGSGGEKGSTDFNDLRKLTGKINALLPE